MENIERKKFYLFRHGETNWNIERKVKGHSDNIDTRFTDLGYIQLNQIMEIIEKEKIQAIFSSDLRRTYNSSMYINEKLKLPLYFTKSLRGLNMGVLEGKTLDELKNIEEAIRSLKDYTIPMPNGESINHLIERIESMMNYVYNSYQYNRVAMITHGAVVSNIKSAVKKDDYEHIDYCFVGYDGKSFDVFDDGTYTGNDREKVLVRKNRGLYE